MKISETYRADFAPQMRKSALLGLMHCLGLTLLACMLVVGAAGSASAAEAQTKQPFARSEMASLRLSFRRMPSSEHHCSPKMEPSSRRRVIFCKGGSQW
jgi:hypothetical protein